MSTPKPGEPGFVPPGGITCQECSDFLLEYVEQTLPAEQRLAFDRHTDGCPACEVYLTNYKRITQMAANAAPAAPAGPVPQALLAAILKARKSS